jgi:hypothetical protein
MIEPMSCNAIIINCCTYLPFDVFTAMSSLIYEKVCVLFNIAALQSCVAATQSLDTDDGRKMAAKLLQVCMYHNHKCKLLVKCLPWGKKSKQKKIIIKIIIIKNRT